MQNDPMIIQGGMGVAVSHWPLARTVAQRGGLGVVSGTALATVLVRRLQSGDPGGHIRRALAAFPVPQVSEVIMRTWYRPDGLPPGEAYKRHAMYTLAPSRDLVQLTVAAAFAEVYLAKEGHSGQVGINLLEKVHLPNPATLYGAMLADVDYVLMGAGIPMEIPGILDRLAEHRPVRLAVPVEGEGPAHLDFDPGTAVPEPGAPLRRPKFLAIIASAVLAAALAKKATGRVDGFIIEGPTAGGHNAPPRGAKQLNERGEPVYGPKDEVNLEHIKALGRPFWLAGSYGAPEKLGEALAQGAAGIQVGTAFAFSDESGFCPAVKQAVLERAASGTLETLTDPLASPTGFPFKVAGINGSLADAALYADRERICDLGYLRQLYRKPDGAMGYRCPAEPVATYVNKGGREEDTEGRKCLCNGLLAAAGFAQRLADDAEELPLITAGDEVQQVVRFLKPGAIGYSANDVLDALFEGVAAVG